MQKTPRSDTVNPMQNAHATAHAASEELEAVNSLTYELFGEEPLSIERIPYGKVNIVFDVSTRGEGELIYHLHENKRRSRLFYRWGDGLDLAREKGIPVPSVLATGDTLVPYAYVVYRKIHGVPAMLHEGDKGKAMEDIGLAAKRINLIGVPGYGKVGWWKDTSRESYGTWREYVDEEFARFEDGTLFDGLGFTDERLLAELRRRIGEMRAWDFEPKLIHGDMSLNNTIVGERGEIAGIIDWDEMSYGKAPEQEIAAAIAWVGDEEKKRFLSGYGMSAEEYAEREHDVETFLLLKFVEYFAWNARIGDRETAGRLLARARAIAEKGG